MGLGREAGGDGGGGGEELIFFLTTWKQNFVALPNLYIAGFKQRKMGKFIPDRKNTIIKIFDKSIRKN